MTIVSLLKTVNKLFLRYTGRHCLDSVQTVYGNWSVNWETMGGQRNRRFPQNRLFVFVDQLSGIRIPMNSGLYCTCVK